MAANVFRGGTKTEKDVPGLQKQTQDYALKVELERMRVEALDNDLDVCKRRIRKNLALRRSRGGHDAPKQAQFAINKQIRLLEENLHRRLLKLGDVETACGNYRHSINELRQEQVALKEVYQNLRDEMAEMQGRMDVALEEAAAVCEERDAAFSALTEMHDRVESAEKAHRKAMRMWHKKVREEKQRQEILRVKLNKHEDSDSGLRMLIELQNTKRSQVEERKQQLELTRRIEQETAAEESGTVEKYYLAFDKLKELTMIDDVNRLVEMFVAVEDENFATFNFIQRLNQQIEQSEEALARVRAEQAAYRESMGETDKSRSTVIMALEAKLNKTLQQHEEFQASAVLAEEQLRHLATVVDSIFHKAECDQMSGLRHTWSRPEEKKISASAAPKTAEIHMLQGDQHPMVMPTMSLQTLMQHGVVPMTMLEYLGIMEQRAAEIINAYQTFQSATSVGLSLPVIPPKSATPVVPPSRPLLGRSSGVAPVRVLAIPREDPDDDEYEASGDEAAPLGRDKLKELAMMTLRREMEAAASRKAHKKDSSHLLAKSASKMPRIGHRRLGAGRRTSVGGLGDGAGRGAGAGAKKRTNNTMHSRAGLSRSTPAFSHGAHAGGHGAWD